MTILMNYKRTVEDFKRCGTKASTVYGLPFVSDCVGADDRFVLVLLLQLLLLPTQCC